MPLTPEDVANKQFTSTRLKPGYDETEVDEFLDEVEAELTRLYRETDELRAKLAAAGTGDRAPVESADVSGLQRENEELRSKLSTAERQLAEVSSRPAAAAAPAAAGAPQPAQAPGGAESATGILALAQRTADEHIAEARTQADRIIGEARTRADQLKREAEDRHRQTIGALETERSSLEREVEKLRAFEREYRTRLKSYLEGQLRELDGRGSDTAAANRPGAPGAGQPGSSGQSAGASPAPQGGQSGQHAQPGQPQQSQQPQQPQPGMAPGQPQLDQPQPGMAPGQPQPGLVPGEPQQRSPFSPGAPVSGDRPGGYRMDRGPDQPQ